MALNAGIPKSTLQRMGNWKSPVIVDRYAHLADETLRSAAGELDRLVEQSHQPFDDGDDDACSEPRPVYRVV